MPWAAHLRLSSTHCRPGPTWWRLPALRNSADAKVGTGPPVVTTRGEPASTGPSGGCGRLGHDPEQSGVAEADRSLDDGHTVGRLDRRQVRMAGTNGRRSDPDLLVDDERGDGSDIVLIDRRPHQLDAEQGVRPDAGAPDTPVGSELRSAGLTGHRVDLVDHEDRRRIGAGRRRPCRGPSGRRRVRRPAPVQGSRRTRRRHRGRPPPRRGDAAPAGSGRTGSPSSTGTRA